ncbi:hypothetical protein [Massilia sp. Root335]|uniref:hypothetical protein n=1 Tax=Massilia sp. Root335 TaxID=1736517 RepID=UPI000B2AEC10|nr:hypothetical protein [Massilia sp. Root335]
MVIPVVAGRDMAVGEKSGKRIAEIGNGNWIYIWRRRKLQSSLNESTTELT